MESRNWAQAISFSALALSVLALAGCGGAGGNVADKDAPGTPAEASLAAEATCAVAENWCIEHGVPEDLCGQCNAKVAAECQRKGDWCKEHNRPQSQCFLCNPKLEAKFAAEYEAKYGKKPPKPSSPPR